MLPLFVGVSTSSSSRSFCNLARGPSWSAESSEGKRELPATRVACNRQHREHLEQTGSVWLPGVLTTPPQAHVVPASGPVALAFIWRYKGRRRRLRTIEVFFETSVRATSSGNRFVGLHSHRSGGVSKLPAKRRNHALQPDKGDKSDHGLQAKVGENGKTAGEDNNSRVMKEKVKEPLEQENDADAGSAEPPPELKEPRKDCVNVHVSGQCVPVGTTTYIPIPPEVLQERLGQRVKAWHEGKAGPDGADMAHIAWNEFCGQLRVVVLTDLKDLASGLIASYQPFDPAWRRWVGTWPLPDEEAKFARNLMQAAKLAGFTPVSRIDLERTREFKTDLLSLPVTIHWDRLDSRWIEDLFKHSATAGLDPDAQHDLDPDLSDFGDYAIVLKRGLAVQRREGRLLMEKLDNIQSTWLIRSGGLLRSGLLGSVALCVAVWTRALVPSAAAIWANVLAPIVRVMAKAAKTLLPVAEQWVRGSLFPVVEQWVRGSKVEVFVVHARESSRRFARRTRVAVRQRAKRLWPWVKERFRGVRMHLAGTQVLRRLQPERYQYTYWLFDNVLKKGRWSRERVALIQRLSEAWRQEARLRGTLIPSSAVPEEEAERERREALSRGDYVERVTMEDVPLSWRSLLQPAKLQEPQFQEILVAYRLQEPVRAGPGGLLPWDEPPEMRPLPQRPIYVRRFFEVPMKHIKMVLPPQVWRVRGRPLDMIKLDLVTVAGLLSVFWKLSGYAKGGNFIFLPLVVLAVKTFLGHRHTRFYYKSVTSTMLFDKCLDKDSALMRLLPDAAEAQVFNECLLAFWALLDLGARRGRKSTSNHPLSPAVLEVDVERHATRLVNSLLDHADLPKAGFRANLRQALLRLEGWQLVTAVNSDKSSRSWCASALDEAPQLLRAMRVETLRKECEP